MKKVLLSTSALALMGAMTTANAAEWDIKLGGYMEQHVGYASNDTASATDFDGVHTVSDQEFYFRPSITLDNGIKIAARMDFEGAANGGVDEPQLIISGSFGSLTLGEDDTAASDVMVVAPDVSFLGINSGSEVNYLPGDGLVPQDGHSRGTFLNLTGDDRVIKYFTPRFAGFQVGASYSRDGRSSSDDDISDLNGGAVEGVSVSNVFGVGANYTNSFGGVDLAIGAGWQTNELVAGGTAEQYGAGINVGFGGFTVGGSFAEGNDTGDDGRSYDVGVSYETGPWGVSFTYLHGENSDGAGGNDEVDSFQIAVDYDLAKGVRLGAYGLYVDEDDASSNADYDGATGDYSSFIIGTGIRVSF